MQKFFYDNISLKIFSVFFMLMILCTGSFSQQLEYKIMTRQDSAQIIHFSNDYKTADSKGNTAEAAENLNQIAQIYWNNNQDLNAVEYYQKSLKLNEKLGNENGISGINNNLGLLYSDLGKYQEALNCFQKTLVYRKTVRGKGEALSSIYLNISQVYIKLKDYPNAAKQLEESLNYAREEGNQERMQSCYGSLAEIYEKAGDQAKADANFKLYKDYNDMLSRKAEDKFNEANFRATQAENEKLKKENELLNKENELRKKNIELANSTYKNKTLFENLTDAEKKAEYYKKDAQVKQLINEKKLENRKKFITIILTAIVFLIVFIFFLLRYNRQKAETNRKLEYQNTEILQQREEIMQQRDNLEDAFGRIAKQNGELTEANKNIEEKNRNITESINYALLIQEAVLTKTETFNAFFSESFILYKPRDIVSGDFYWHCKVEDKIVVAAVDCTGHGVPGAFLSMAGNELLNRIVEVQKITDPGKILSEMDRGVRQILHQDVSDNDDGMDMTLITFDLKKNKMYFAGAVNPIFVVENGDVAVIPGSKHSIGGLVYTKVNKSFETTEIQYTKDSVVYMFSDGFQDQLNPTNGRFSIPAFKNLLYQIHKEPFDRQKELLEEAHIQWKLDSKQTDDILVMGFKTTIE